MCLKISKTTNLWEDLTQLHTSPFTQPARIQRRCAAHFQQTKSVSRLQFLFLNIGEHVQEGCTILLLAASVGTSERLKCNNNNE